MRYISICLSVLFLGSSFNSVKVSRIHSQPVKLIYENVYLSYKQDVSAIAAYNTFADSLYDSNGMDSLLNRSLKEINSSDLWPEAAATKFYIEVLHDSIWRHTRQNEKMIGDYTMILKKNDGIIHLYDKSKKWNYQKFDLLSAQKDAETTVTTNKNDRKIIHGYDCFKLIIVEEGNEDFSGKTICEMYVTYKIDLPAYVLEPAKQNLPGLFPLEVVVKTYFMPAMQEVYRLVEIE